MKLRRLAVFLALASATVCLPCIAQTRPTATSGVWIDVPFAAQTKDGCGSASIAMVMQYWDRKEGRPIGQDANPRKIQSILYSHRADGIFSSSMKKYLQQSGYRAFAFNGRWTDLEHHLALGRPLIVGLAASGPLGPLHYVVVVGVDPERGYVFVNDPAQQKMLRLSRKGFESEWRHTHNWTLLAVPRLPH